MGLCPARKGVGDVTVVPTGRGVVPPGAPGGGRSSRGGAPMPGTEAPPMGGRPGPPGPPGRMGRPSPKGEAVAALAEADAPRSWTPALPSPAWPAGQRSGSRPGNTPEGARGGNGALARPGPDAVGMAGHAPAWSADRTEGGHKGFGGSATGPLAGLNTDSQPGKAERAGSPPVSLRRSEHADKASRLSTAAAVRQVSRSAMASPPGTPDEQAKRGLGKRDTGRTDIP